MYELITISDGLAIKAVQKFVDLMQKFVDLMQRISWLYAISPMSTSQIGISE
jgi:hypothetical protein